MEWVIAKDIAAASMLALVLFAHRSYMTRGQVTLRMQVVLAASTTLAFVAMAVDPAVSVLDPAKGVRIGLYLLGGSALILMATWFFVGVRSRSGG